MTELAQCSYELKVSIICGMVVLALVLDRLSRRWQ
jgi:hypothetical protein